MDPIVSGLIASVVANGLTSLVPQLFQRKLDTKVKKAYVRALKRWTKHDVEWESRKYKERLVDLVDYMQNPQGRQRYASDIELLEYYKEELRKDTEVWTLIEESLLTDIFTLLQDTNRLTQEIKSYHERCQISQKEFMESQKRLLDLQMRRNISSGKYLEDTYLEVDELKEQLRFFVDPFLFFQLSCERTAKLNFDNLRWVLAEQKSEGFEFDAEKFVGNSTRPAGFELLYEASRRLSDYLLAKHNELHGGGNIRYCHSRKIKDILDLNNCIYKRFFILTSKAGQGKTNVLCDLAKNVLMRREIPAAYLNGYELEAGNVEMSFAHKLFSAKNFSLDDVLKAAECYCEQHQVPFVIIIDGLNENGSPKQLQASMETFLSTVLQYDFVKVIVSCRTEYYDTHFSSIGDLFEDDTIIQRNINGRLDDYWEKLKELYFKHFSISCTDITDHVKRDFCENLLLFRIFCEVNARKNLTVIHSIAKEPLFAAYCEIMVSRVAAELKSDGCSLAADTFISDFLKKVVGRMVENDAFANIPLATLLAGADIQQREIINRFLDNNVLMRKDLKSVGSSPFASSEVVNFTFDEFRDYLVSHYLVDVVLPENQADFSSYVIKYTDSKHLLSEGLTTFLFSYIKRTKDPFALTTIQTQPWYKLVFRNMIWDVEETDITDDDIALIKQFLSVCDIIVARYLTYWGRWNTDVFKRINIKLLLEHLSSLDGVELRNFFDKTWSDVSRNAYYSIYDREPSPREKFLDNVRCLIENEEHSLKHPEQRNLFEIVLYMSAIDYSARMLYDDYFSNTNDERQIKDVVSVTKCVELKNVVKEWLKM
jgi:hypothetical protein